MCRSQSIVLNSCQADSVPVISGVPQGSVLGPTLFLLYINDVSTIIFQNLAVTCKLYANDIKLYSCYSTNCRSVHDLSEASERLSAWSQTWPLHLAANKCFVFAVKNPKIYSSDHTYTLANSYLSHVNLICDLSVTPSSLKLDGHVSLFTHAAFVRSRLILKCFHSRDRCQSCVYVCPFVD
jgi:ribonucleases P/MRP protein subunit RPP40